MAFLAGDSNKTNHLQLNFETNANNRKTFRSESTLVDNAL